MKTKEGGRTHSDKKTRVSPYLDPDTYAKLNRLARACNTTSPKLLEFMAEYLLNLPDFVRWVQDVYKVPDNDLFRIIPIIKDGKIQY
jgi:hypothetical protein